MSFEKKKIETSGRYPDISLNNSTQVYVATSLQSMSTTQASDYSILQPITDAKQTKGTSSERSESARQVPQSPTSKLARNLTTTPYGGKVESSRGHRVSLPFHFLRSRKKEKIVLTQRGFGRLFIETCKRCGSLESARQIGKKLCKGGKRMGQFEVFFRCSAFEKSYSHK